MASVTVTIPQTNWNFTSEHQFFWSPPPANRISLGTSLSVDGTTELMLAFVFFRDNGQLAIQLALSTEPRGDVGPDFSDQMESEGIITFSDPAGTLVVTGIGDATEPYSWTPSNSVESRAFHDAVDDAWRTQALVPNLTVTFNDNAPVPPDVTASGPNTPQLVNALIGLTGTASDPNPQDTIDAYGWVANSAGLAEIDAETDPGATAWGRFVPTYDPANDPVPLAIDFQFNLQNSDQRTAIFTFSAEDNTGRTGTGQALVSVRANQAPIAEITAGMLTFDAGQSTTLMVTATDPEGSSVTYQWAGHNNTVLSGTLTSTSVTWTAPTVSEASSFDVMCQVSDGHRTTTATITLFVRAPLVTLVLPAVSDQSFVAGNFVSLALPKATDGATPFIYSASGLPPGLGYQDNTIQGIPTTPGTYTVSYDVTDSNQDMETQEFTITITGDAVAAPAGLNVRIDFGGLFYGHALADVTGKITSDIAFDRGKATASSVLARSQAGRMTFDLQNSDGLFDEENPNSALDGLIYPGIGVQLRDGDRPLWTGVLDEMPTRYELSGQHRSEVSALGILSQTVESEVNGGSLAPESTAQAFIELCSKAGVPYEAPQPAPGLAYVMRRWWMDTKLRGALNRLEDTEGGLIFEDREGELGFHLRSYRAGRTKVKTFVSTTPGTDEIRIVGRPRRELAVKDVHNVVVGEVPQFESGTGETIASLSDPIQLIPGQRADLYVRYPQDRGGVSALDALVANTDWTANVESDGSGSDRSGQIQVAAVIEDFNFIRLTLTRNTGTTGTAYVTSLLLTGTVLSLSQALEPPPAVDSTSISRYKRRTHRLRDTWIATADQMTARITSLLAALAQPERRVQLDWYIDDWDDFLAIDNGDRVGISLPTLTSDAFVEAERVLIPLSRANIRCTMDLSLVA